MREHHEAPGRGRRLPHVGAMTKKTETSSGRWLKGCALGCGLVAFLGILLTVGGSMVMKFGVTKSSAKSPIVMMGADEKSS